MSILPQNGSFGLFSIDPGATPDQIAKKRAMIAAMMPQYGKARYVGEGIGQLATGIATGMANRKMDKFEAGKRAEASEAYRNLVGGGPLSVLGMKDDWGTTFAAEEAPPADPMSPDAIGRDAMAAIGRGGADEIRSGLIKRGLPEHIADGFMMNFQDESGLDPGINEASPLVPGSRGGFGLSQWTGPRRRALEAFAADRGAPVADVNTQLDFLMSELRGPESAAAREIFGSKTSGEAAAAIVNKFLRPAEEHRASREARYLGGSSRVGTGPQVAYNGPSVAELSSALSNPWLSQEERGVVGMMLQQAQQANDPMRAMEMERAQLELDALRNPQPTKGTVVGNRIIDPTTGRVIYEPEPGANPLGEYGLSPVFGKDEDGNVVVMQLGKDGTAVATKLPEGVSPDLGVKTYEAARGTAIGKAEGESVVSSGSDMQAAQNALDLIDSIRNDPARKIGTGKSSIMGAIPGTKAYDFARKVEQAKSGAFMTAIQQLRGMGALSNNEGQTATAAVTRMSTAMTEKGFLEALADYEKIVRQGYDKAARAGGAAPAQPGASGTATHRFNPATGKIEAVQ